MGSDKYDSNRESKRRYDKNVSVAGRDIGGIPQIRDWERRELCRDDPELFCTTYNPDAFTLPFSQDHRDLFRRAKDTLELGLLHAFAMDRGKGKTTICRMLALWAVSYAIRRYVFMIGANLQKAQDNLDAIKTYARFLPLYAADFPEIAHAARRLDGIANRATGQLCGGEPTLIEWGKDRIVLPTVPVPKNWPAHWPKRDDGMAPTSGSVIAASGLTGDGIRGSLITLNTGESLRPDFVLLDDPQTAESAGSPTQNATRLQLVAADILGMAGPGKTISALMPCTVIRPGDMVDEILDRKKHPLWRGERRRMLNKMPTNMAAWDKYFIPYQECAQREPPDYTESNAYYLEHRAELEEGAEPSWPERKLPGEISAIQHAMHLYFRNIPAFFSEYQNQPLAVVADDVDLPKLTPSQVAARLNNHDRGTAPAFANLLTAGIDVQQDLLYWTVCAWGDGFSGAVVDYGVWPEQRRTYFALRDAAPTIREATGIGDADGALRAALKDLSSHLLSREWPVDSTAPLRIRRCLVDSGWKTDVVYRFCRESQFASSLTPSKGYGITPAKLGMDEWPRKEGETRRWNCILRPAQGRVRAAVYDTYPWKSFIVDRLLTPEGSPSALMLFGKAAHEHRMFADHLDAEFRVRTEGRGRRVDVWSIKAGRPDNHWFDTLVQCAVAASIEGASLLEPVKRGPSAAERRRRQLEALKAKQTRRAME